ncbi:MAG: RluA family pseudouridine synthase [Vicinamibacterales bacterium]
MRLDQCIRRHLAAGFGLSRAAIQRLIDDGGVCINGAPATRAAQRLAAGDIVDVAAAPRPPRPAPLAESRRLAILYEDDDLLVVVKPAGMVAHPTSRQRGGTMVNALLGHADDTGWTPRLVQRLDRDTSGLMLVAKSGDVHAALQAASTSFEKDYLAVVWGRPAPDRGVLDGLLGRDPLDRRRMMVSTSGAPSMTEYEVLARSTGDARGLSLVRCRLGTGRTHQIRVHLADRGWPIVGDPTYGGAPRRRLVELAVDRAARGFPRQALHAWRLAFRLPSTGQRRVFQTAPPDDMIGLIRTAGLGRQQLGLSDEY